jgi:hypothetical protein
MKIRWTKAQRENAWRVANDIAEGDDNRETRGMLRQVVAIYADELNRVLSQKAADKTDRLLRSLNRLDCLVTKRESALKKRVSELLCLLDTVEESDDGRKFHPTTINTCRTLHALKLEKLLPKIKALL